MVEFSTLRPEGVIFNADHERDSDDDIQIIEDFGDPSLPLANNSTPPPDPGPDPAPDSDSDIEVIETFENVEPAKPRPPRAPIRRTRYRLISSTSSSGDDEDVSHKSPKPFQKPFQQKISDQVRDGEDDIFIPFDDDDEDDGAEVEYNEQGHPKCRICGIVFRNKIKFRMHQRRHFAANHFMCPTCSRGFTSFAHCQTHELKEHHRKSADAACSKSDEEDYYSHEPPGYIVTSTSLYRYRGPPMQGQDQVAPYDTFLKYSRSERRSHSMIQAKYTLSCQQKQRQIRDQDAALQKKQKAKESKEKLPPAKARRRTAIVNSQTDEEAAEAEVANATPDDDDADYIPNSLKKRKRKAIMNKWYYCDICYFQCGGELEMRNHARVKHPGIPVSEVVHFIYPPETSRPKRMKLPNDLPVEPKVDPTTVQKKEVKQKKLKRLKIYRRVWEKDGKVPKKIEFLSALGLVGKSDVILGPRKGTAAIYSSLYHKRKGGRRERSKSPRSQVILEKLPSAENKCYRTCLHCEFFALTRADIRRHCAEVHPGIGSGTSNPPPNRQNVQPQSTLPKQSTQGATMNSSAASGPCYVRCSICQYNASSKLELDTHFRLSHRIDEIEKMKKLSAAKFIR